MYKIACPQARAVVVRWSQSWIGVWCICESTSDRLGLGRTTAIRGMAILCTRTSAVHIFQFWTHIFVLRGHHRYFERMWKNDSTIMFVPPPPLCTTVSVEMTGDLGFNHLSYMLHFHPKVAERSRSLIIQVRYTWEWVVVVRQQNMLKTVQLAQR